MGSPHPEGQEPPCYSSFSIRQRRSIAVTAALSAVFSTLSSFIYFPAITAISHDLHVSVSLVNLSITTYQIVSGIAPSILMDAADQSGRRPALLVAFTIYFFANFGLALQSSYPALMVLRCFQAAGASSTFTIAYGFVSDIAPPSQRGSYVSIIQGIGNSAPSIGPILGGAVTQSLSWRWVFWLLCIMCGTHLLFIVLFLPETSRNVVEDGNKPPPRVLNRSVYNIVTERKVDRTHIVKPKIRMPNPLACLRTLFQKGSFIVILIGGIQYTLQSAVAASLSTQMIRIYSLNYLEGGLVYLPAGVGGIFAAYTMGKIVDHDFRATAKRHGKDNVQSSKDLNDLSDFPLEEARLRSIFIFILINTASVAGYGWTLEAKAHLAAPLILQFLIGYSQVSVFAVCGTLLIDLNPDRSATVQASYSLIRCALAATGLAVVQPMIDGVGPGWCFTIFAVVGACCVPLFYVLGRKGWDWRKPALQKDAEKAGVPDATPSSPS